MAVSDQERTLYKDSVIKKLNEDEKSALKKYQNFFVGSTKMSKLIQFEVLNWFLGPMPGAPGLALRKAFYPSMFKSVGSGVVWGRNISVRHPGNISIGDRVAIDDNCLIDAKGAGEAGIKIGNDVLIARDSIVQAKVAPIEIGDHCIISSQCQLSSAGGIVFGKHVLLAGQCYIGGGRYRTDDLETPIMFQDLYSKGPVVIEDNVWIGAGVVIQDGVRIGEGSVIGSGAIVREDIPPFTTVVPNQRLVMLPRKQD